MANVTFNEDQLEAIDLAVNWYRDYRDSISNGVRGSVRPFFALGGYAGTGKTTVARYIASKCCDPSRTKYIAPTGKAASRLRDKGCQGAQTIHRFLYNYLGNNFDDTPEFQVKSSLEEQPLLIVCDEASMINQRMGDDIISKGIPVLFLGDLGQVDPVSGDPFLSPEDFNYNLEKIERNGGNIVRASFYVRNGGRLPAREYDDVKVYDRRYTMKDVEEHLDNDSVMLCSYNSTRQMLNLKARIALGNSESKMPVIGEKLICTFNQHNYAIANGEQFILMDLRDLKEDEISPTDDEFFKMATLLSITNNETKLAKFNLMSFIGSDEDEINSARKRIGGFDFGFALTIHKAQGSEWGRVMLIEEYMRSTPYARLQYTGITRAMNHLTMFRASKL